jgi:hypothetical protein
MLYLGWVNPMNKAQKEEKEPATMGIEERH